ncbi:AAA family ATPase [Pseudarthrobacter sp. N5]|uniref:AAA family ATPase n=1 Tax=Pseudarthrobacter sp. N5 TaxID=3418416 RepID=UPI003CF8A918
MLLIDRDKELDRILALIRSPKDAALIIIGKQGTGKSRLLAEIPQLHHHRTVFLRANAAESHWPYSGLTALLNGLDDPILSQFSEELFKSSTPGIEASAFASLLLGGLQRRTTVRTVIVIDDVDELDPSSQTVIGFLARRLAGTGLTCIVSMREESNNSPFAHLPSMTLSNLGPSETVRMLESIPVQRTSTAEIHYVAAVTHGNPLAAKELYGYLMELQLRGKYALPVPLHWKSSFDSELETSIAGLTRFGRDALDLLSLTYRTSLSTLEKISSDLWSGVDELLTAGIAVSSGPDIRVQDQLLRSHVVAAMSATARTANHQALADATESTDPLSRHWHDTFLTAQRETSFSLLRCAVDLVRAGETQFAVEYIERALTINPWEGETAARLATIAEMFYKRGEFVYAKRYLDWAQRITRNRSLTLRLCGLNFQIEFMRGSTVRPYMVLRLVKEFGHLDPSYSFCLLSIAAIYHAERWELEDARDLLAHAEAFVAVASSEALAVNSRAKLLVEAVSGRRNHVARIDNVPEDSSAASLLLQGRALTYAEDYTGAREVFNFVRNLGEVSDTNWTETARYFAADNEIRSGNFRAAVRLIQEIDTSESAGNYHRGARNASLLWRSLVLGDDALTQICLTEARRFASSESHPAVAAQLAACQGQFALMRGDLAEALAQLTRSAEIGLNFGNPALLRGEADLVEVLVRLGRHRDAVRALSRLEKRANGLNSRWLTLSIARCRALVADGERSLELFGNALEIWQSHDPVFERARTILCYADRLRALGSTADAKDFYHRAKVLFDESGASAWMRHVDSLLLGEPAESSSAPRNPALMLLTDHERSLAQMVARGRRNKEIAASLYVSVRTVEVRLTGIYRKLGVQSRSQLSALVMVKDHAEHRSDESEFSLFT